MALYFLCSLGQCYIQNSFLCCGFMLFLISSLCRLDELNLSWCYDFTEKHVQVAVAHVSETITQLNLSGYRKNLQRSGKTHQALRPSQRPHQQEVSLPAELLSAIVSVQYVCSRSPCSEEVAADWNG